MAEVAVAGEMGRKPPPVSVQTCRDQSPRMRWSQLLLCSFPSLSQTRNLHALIPRKHSLLSSFLMVSILRESSSPASPFPAALHSGEEHCSFSRLRWKPLLSLQHQKSLGMFYFCWTPVQRALAFTQAQTWRAEELSRIVAGQDPYNLFIVWTTWLSLSRRGDNGLKLWRRLLLTFHAARVDALTTDKKHRYFQRYRSYETWGSRIWEINGENLGQAINVQHLIK